MDQRDWRRLPQAIKRGAKIGFSYEWSSQKELGAKFGLTGAEVGKILTQHKLKDPHTGKVSEEAINQGLAKLAVLPNGEVYFVWQTKKIIELISQKYRLLTKVEYWANYVRKIYAEAHALLQQGNEKQAHFMYESALDKVPGSILLEVEALLAREEALTQIAIDSDD